MRNTIVFCSWISQIALEWLHQGCNSDLSADFLNFGAASNFPFEIPFKKCFKIVFFPLWRRAAISDAVARSSIVFLNSVSASSCDSAVHEGKGHRYQTLRLLAVYDRFRTAGSSCAQQRECVSAASTATNAYVLQSANLRNLLQRKVEEERNLES